MNVSQAIIMVGGKGTRLRPLTDNIPKPILPVLDRPCISYLIDSIIASGIDNIILACGPHSEKIIETIGDGSDLGVSIEYSIEKEPMGTAGAVKLLEKRLDDAFVLANGDVFADINIKKEVDEHKLKDAAITIALTPVENPCEFGIARMNDDGRIIEFKEKPKPNEVFSNLINAGVYVLSKAVIECVPPGKFFDFSKDLVPLLIKDRRIYGHVIEGMWMDVGRPGDLIRANLLMAERPHSGKDFVTEDTTISEPFYAGDGCKIVSSSVMNSVISERCSVEDSEIVGSLLLPGCKIIGSRIENSIIGRDGIIVSSVVKNSSLADESNISGREIDNAAR